MLATGKSAEPHKLIRQWLNECQDDCGALQDAAKTMGMKKRRADCDP